jgi:hypothetical protein
MPVLAALPATSLQGGVNGNSTTTTSSANNNNNNSGIHWRSRFQAELRQFSWRGVFLDGACCCFARQNDDESSKPSTSTSFDIQDPGTDRMIDIRASFAPTGTFVLLWKSIATVWISSVIVIGIMSDIRAGRMGNYVSWFSNWGTVSSFCYISISFINSAFANNKSWGMVRQPDIKRSPHAHAATQYPNLWTRFTWALFTVAAHTGLSIALIFWNFILFVDSSRSFARADLSVCLRHYQDIMTHGIVAILILIDGFVVNRIPIRLAHGWQFVVWWYLLYMLWMPINQLFMSQPVFYLQFMTRDLSGRLAPIQDPSPRFIFAAFVLHVITGTLVLCYGFVVNSRSTSRRLPVWLAYFGKVVVFCDLIALIWPAIYEVLGKELEYCIGKVLPGLVILTIWCPILQIILFAFSGLSRRRYLPVNVPNSKDGVCTTDESVDDDEMDIVTV